MEKGGSFLVVIFGGVVDIVDGEGDFDVLFDGDECIVVFEIENFVVFEYLWFVVWCEVGKVVFFGILFGEVKQVCCFLIIVVGCVFFFID